MTNYKLKPFNFDLADLQFLIAQINFVPLFDAAGNAIVAWDGIGAIYKTSAGAALAGNEYATAGMTPEAAIAMYGTSYDTLTAAQGLRNVSGIDNNLLLVNHLWGAVDQPFQRDAGADFSHYVQPFVKPAVGEPVGAYYGAENYNALGPHTTITHTFDTRVTAAADYTNTASHHATDVVDYTPRMISRLVTTGGATPLLDPVTHQVVHFNAALYASETVAATYHALIVNAGIDINAQFEGALIELTPAVVLVDENGDPLVWDSAQYANDAVYKALVDNSGVNIASLFEGAPIEITPAVNLTDAQGDTVVWDSALYDTNLDYKTLIDGSGVDAATLIDGAAVVKDWGILAGGQHDPQDPTNGEFFFGAINPGVAPGNSWLAYFGQFFDHGLDFVSKGAAGVKIVIPLATDDPLYRAPDTNIPGDRGNTQITVSRADVAGYDADGTPQYTNHTSPYIDQSQTYGSHAQMTTLLREWVLDPVTHEYHAGAHLLDGETSVAWTNAWGETTTATLPTLNELRAHLVATGRDDLSWHDVLDLRLRDEHGHVIDTDASTAGIQSTGSGQALLLDMNPHFDTSHFSAATITALDALGIHAKPDGSYAFGGPGSLGQIINFATFEPMSSNASQALNDLAYEVLLESVGDHYIAGDGRVNENVGLTAIHHVFHEEHNFQVRNLQEAILGQDARAVALGDTSHSVAHDWQVGIDNGAGGFFTDTAGNYTLSAGGAISWNESKLFDAAKLTVEMEYQHAAVDQYARTITPDIPEFVGYNSGENATVSLEYAQGAFRFGHSTMRETIDFMDPTGSITGKVMSVALEQAFLNPQLYSQTGAAAIAMGMTHQQMNEIDELLTPAMNQGLLGQPLDLATINIARGRDIGLPTLNDFREAIGLTRYTSWNDFGGNMVHPDNLASFIAAYSLDGDLAKAQAIIAAETGDTAALQGMLGFTGDAAFDYALDFLNGGNAGFNKIDTWLGGLAEVHVMGGLLGETFNVVFVDQINRLMDGDRFYYLYRLNNLNMGDEIANAQFKDIVERNTGLEHLNGSIFAYADQYVDLSASVDPEKTTGDFRTDHKYGGVVLTSGPDEGENAIGSGLGIYSTGGVSTNGNGTTTTIGGVTYLRDIRAEGAYGNPNVNGENLDGTPDTGANSNEVLVATDNNDLIYMLAGDDTAYGEGGDDIIYGGAGIDRLYGGDGRDTIYGGDSGDLIDGGAGDDKLYGDSSGSAAAGVDQIIGSEGNDIIYGGVGIDKLSGGAGDDIIFGGGDTDAFTHGGDGNDYIDGGTDGDLLWGDGGDDLIVGGNNQDIVAGLDGDDILRPGNPSSAMGGGPDEVLGGDGRSDAGNDGQGVGFDLIDFSDYVASVYGVNADFVTQTNPLVAIDGTTPFPAWVGIEGIIGSRNNDTVLADANDNWLIGGSGDDKLEGGIGDDLIIGDGIRLDSLIGTYSGSYTHNFDGASHRAFDEASTAGDRVIGTNGLLDVVDFEKHFTTMLQSDIFKDLELGGSTVSTLNGVADTSVGDGGTAGSDTVVFTGVRNDYIVEKVIFTTAHQGNITAYRITDTVAGRDGTDVVLGVENFKFSNITLTEANLPEVAPVITSNGGLDTAAIAIAENVAAIATVTGTDGNNVPGNPLDGQILTYSIVGGADAAQFFINAITGQLSFITAPNFEAPTDVGVNNVYDVIVQLSDGILADTQALAVTVQNVDEANTGALHIATYTQTNSAASLTATNTIADADVPALVPTNQWQQLNGAVWTNVAAPAGTTATLSNLSNGTYRVTSTYTDPFGAHTVISDETAIIGTNAANTLTGTFGNDIVLGLNGGDTLSASLNVAGTDGNDTYDGGNGTDTYSLSATSAAAAINLVTGIATSSQTGTDTLISIENVTGSSGNDTIIMAANNVRNVVDGSAGSGDTADFSAYATALSVTLTAGTATVGGSGSGTNTDQLTNIENFIGGSAGDSITGNGGANWLFGGGGADTLAGAGGQDRLTGGLGNDIFDFNATADSGTTAATRDIITDFFQGQDLIDLTTIDANTGAGGNQNFSVVLGGPSATVAAFTAAAQIRYFQVDTDGDAIVDSTVIQGNVNNTLGAAEFEILLDHYLGALTTTDFNL